MMSGLPSREGAHTRTLDGGQGPERTLEMDTASTAKTPSDDSRRPATTHGMSRVLERLAGLLGLPFHASAALEAASASARQGSVEDGDPARSLESLASAARACGMRGTLVRMSVADAVWQARSSNPFVAVTRSGDWVVFAGRGFFDARVSRADGEPGWETVGRGALARRLGLEDARESTDLLVMHPELPMTPLEAQEEHDDGHAHPPPRQRFFQLLRAELPDIWAIVVFSVITGILYLAVPLTVDAAVNNIAFGGQQPLFVQALLILAVALLVFLGLLAFIRAVQHYLVEVIQRRVFVRIVADLACRLPRVTAGAMERIHGPELVNRFFDVTTVQKSTSLLLLDGINLLLSAVIGMVVLGFYHPSLLAFDLVMLAAVVVVVFALGRRAVQTSVRESMSKYAIAGWLEELAHYPNLFKTPWGSRMAMERADHLAREYLTRRRASFLVLIRQVGGLLFIQAVASSALLAVGGMLVLEGELTLGQLVASELIVNAVLASVAKLGKHLEAWYDALTAADKLGYLVDLEVERGGGEAAAHAEGPGRIEVHEARIGSEATASFVAGPGDRAALVSRDAAGPGLLLDALFGLRTPDHGHVHIHGIDVRQWSLAALRQQVAMVRPDEILSASIEENVRMARAEVGHQEAREALRATGLLDDVLAMPAGLATPLLLGGRPLSRIQRLRLVLARAIAGRPGILLLDEVLDGLEPGALESLTPVLFGPEAPWTLVVASRDPGVIQRCNVVVRLGEGRTPSSPTGSH